MSYLSTQTPDPGNIDRVGRAVNELHYGTGARTCGRIIRIKKDYRHDDKKKMIEVYLKKNPDITFRRNNKYNGGTVYVFESAAIRTRVLCECFLMA